MGVARNLINKMALSSSVLSAKVKHEQEGRSSEGPVTGQETKPQVLTFKICDAARRFLSDVSMLVLGCCHSQDNAGGPGYSSQEHIKFGIILGAGD